MANISQNVNIEMLEKLPDGTYKRKYPKTRADDGTTFDEHLAEKASLEKLGHVKAETDADGKLILDVPKSNYDGIEPPTVTDDETKGYSAGSMWFVDNEGMKVGYVCINATPNEAIWQMLGSKSGVSLYESGNEHENITGGWVQGYYKKGSYEPYPYISKESDHMYMFANGNGNEISLVTNNLINLSSFDTLSVKWRGISANSSSTTSRYRMIISKNKNDSNEELGIMQVYKTGNFNSVEEVDVSMLQDDYYIRFHTYNIPSAAAKAELKIQSVHLS